MEKTATRSVSFFMNERLFPLANLISGKHSREDNNLAVRLPIDEFVFPRADTLYYHWITKKVHCKKLNLNVRHDRGTKTGPNQKSCVKAPSKGKGGLYDLKRFG